MGHPEMPPALDLARAISASLRMKLEPAGVGKIVLDRDEAALCLGLIDGLVELLVAEGKRGN